MDINGTQITDGWLAIPAHGAINGEFSLPVSLDTGAAVLNGAHLVYVTRSQVYVNRCYIAVLGGAGHLLDILDAKHYRNTTVGQVLSAICSNAGETKSPLIDPSILAQRLSFWTSQQGTTIGQLSELASAIGHDWRTLLDGTIWIGTGLPIGVVVKSRRS